MPDNLVRIGPAKWRFDAISEGPTFHARQFENPKRFRVVTRGPVQPGKGEAVAMGDEARLHRRNSFRHIVQGFVFLALVPFALFSGMIGAAVGGIGLAVAGAWQFYEGWGEFKAMTEALFTQGKWTGVYEGREALRKEFWQ